MCPTTLFLLATSVMPHVDSAVVQELSLADSFGDHMVIQQLPAPTVIWGFGAKPNRWWCWDGVCVCVCGGGGGGAVVWGFGAMVMPNRSQLILGWWWWGLYITGLTV